MLVMESTAHAWINNEDILHPLCEIPGGIDAQILFFIINAYNLNHRFGYLRP